MPAAHHLAVADLGEHVSLARGVDLVLAVLLDLRAEQGVAIEMVP